jgi:hypothetical protein
MIELGFCCCLRKPTIYAAPPLSGFVSSRVVLGFSHVGRIHHSIMPTTTNVGTSPDTVGMVAIANTSSTAANSDGGIDKSRKAPSHREGQRPCVRLLM